MMSDELKSRFDRLLTVPVPQNNLDAVVSKGRSMRTQRLVLRGAALVTVIAVGAMVWPSSTENPEKFQPVEQEDPVPHADALVIGQEFEAQPQFGLEGWYSQHTGPRFKGHEDGPAAWISNAPLRSDINESIYPRGSLASLPEDGALMIASLYTRGDFEKESHWRATPVRELPLDLADATGPDHSYEGQPSNRPDVVAYGLDGRVGRYHLQVEAFFSGVPTLEELQDANEALATLEILPPAAEVSYSGAPLAEPTRTHRFNDSANAVTQAHGDSIGLPKDWHFEDLTSFPSTFAFSSFPTKVGLGLCDEGEPLQTLPADGAFVWAYEISRGDELARPEHFSLDPRSLAAFEGSGCRATYLLSFKEGERSMAIWVALGDEASPRTIALTLRSLDSLKLQP